MAYVFRRPWDYAHRRRLALARANLLRSAGAPGVAGAGSYTEAGVTGSGTGADGSAGSGSYTEAGPIASGTGFSASGAAGFGGATEAQDVASGSGATAGISGSGSFTEGQDAASGSGFVVNPATGSGAFTESPDIGSGSAGGPASGSGGYVEANDIASGQGSGPVARIRPSGSAVSTGVNRRTGQLIIGFDHVRQSLDVIFTTRIGERVMRRTFGSNVPGMLGKNITKSTVLRFAAAIIVALEYWEPRFAIKQIAFKDGANPPEKIRAGGLSIILIGEYRPRGHLGDLTPEGAERTIQL